MKVQFGPQRLRGGILLLCSLIIGLAEETSAQWNADPALNMAVCALPQNQFAPVVTAVGNGSVAIAWQDMRRGGNYPHVYIQKLNSAGHLEWEANGTTITMPATSTHSQQVISDGTGGVICAWTHFQSVPLGGIVDIYAQRISASGAAMWGPAGVAICTNEAEQGRPQLVSDGSGGAIITWEDYRPLGHHDIYAQRIDANGQVQWQTDGIVVCTDSLTQEAPKLVADGTGGAVICWGDKRHSSNGTSTLDVYAQRLASNGEMRWATTGVLVTNVQAANIFEICSDGAGGAIVAWNYRGGSPLPSTTPIYAQRINHAGELAWNQELRLSTTPTAAAPTIVEDGSGGAVVAWEQAASSTAVRNISAQRVDPEGNALWGIDGIIVSSVPLIHQRFPEIIGVGGGATIVSWQDDRSGSADLFAQKLSASGVAEWTLDGVAVTTAPGIQTMHQMVGNGAGGAIFTWHDSRGADQDIYASKLEASGNQSAIEWEITEAMGVYGAAAEE